jgi:hypothetical protein
MAQKLTLRRIRCCRSVRAVAGNKVASVKDNLLEAEVHCNKNLRMRLIVTCYFKVPELELSSSHSTRARFYSVVIPQLQLCLVPVQSHVPQEQTLHLVEISAQSPEGTSDWMKSTRTK